MQQNIVNNASACNANNDMSDVKKKIQYWIILNDSPENQFPDADFASWYSNVQGKAYSLMQHFVKKSISGNRLS